MKIFKTNQNKAERVVRLIVSLFLIPTPLILGSSTYSIILSILGGTLFFNSIVGTCYIYRILGVDTYKE
ncbi:DUF2892 domain-containing protein [Candidatus Marinimicrobia bacterium]|jgi:hypothetical protein|nr:DUF2892 domain-containing protein [Candidatus Neomarinimicrobiota bacterium]